MLSTNNFSFEFVFLILFFIVAIVEVYGEYKENTKIQFSTKPLLMPLLILSYFFGVVDTLSIARVDWLIIFALLGGWAGDVFLMQKNQEKWFLFGMIAFLINQIFYIISFFSSIFDTTSFNPFVFTLFGPVFLILLFMLPRFISKTGEMKIPVLIYLIAILVMHIAAILKLAAFQGFPNILIYIGSISFIVSDSTIAVDKWDKEIPNGKPIIMTTYILAQFYITLGVLLSAYL